MFDCDDLLKKQNWKGDNTKSSLITLNGQDELDCFTNDEDSRKYEGGIILTGTIGNIVQGKLYNYKLSSIILSDSMTSIGDGAFDECNWLTSVTIPVTVTSIGAYAFYNCYSLTSFAFPSWITSIGVYAFRGCYRLNSVTFNSNINMANKQVFYECSFLTKIILSDTLKNVNTDMFVDNDLVQLEEIEYFGQNIYNDKNFNMETQKMNIPLKRIRRNIILKPKLKWIIPVSVVSALLLSFIVFKVVRRRPRKQNKKNTKKSKK
jgi:hypothetical protein